MAGERVLHTPAGTCPVKLEGSSLEEVRDWSNLVVEHGRQKNLIYLPSALLYFSQQFYSIFTPEYKEIKAHLEEIFNINKNQEDLFIEEQKSNIKKQEEQKLIEKNLREEERAAKQIQSAASKEKQEFPRLASIQNTENAAHDTEKPVVLKKKRGRPPKNK